MADRPVPETAAAAGVRPERPGPGYRIDSAARRSDQIDRYEEALRQSITRLWADSRIHRIYAGTNEIMKYIIGRTL